MKKVFALALLGMVTVLAGCTSNTTIDPQIDALATCLTEKEVVMYGTESCTFCQKQKRMFGESFAKVTYVDCYAEPLKCQAKGITAYPSREIPGLSTEAGLLELTQLAEKVGCEYTEAE